MCGDFAHDAVFERLSRCGPKPHALVAPPPRALAARVEQGRAIDLERSLLEWNTLLHVFERLPVADRLKRAYGWPESADERAHFFD